MYHTLNLEANESVVTVARRHWITLATSIFSVVTFALIPLIVWFVIMTLETISSVLPTSAVVFSNYFFFGYIIWLLWCWMMLSYIILNHYLDIFAITNERLIIIDQRGFFSRSIGSFRLERLQDINVEINGLLATLLDYGTIEAETASSSNGEFVAHFLPHPQILKNQILEAASKRNQNPL